MNYDLIAPGIFKDLPVKAFFTTKAFPAGEGLLKTQLRAEAVYFPIQKHTDKVLVVEYDLEPRIADAVVTNRKGVAIGVRVADCVPILLYDVRQKVAGAVHAGWRGTADGIIKKTIAVFRQKYNSAPQDVIVAIGPSIKGSCYVVGHEVADAVTKATGEGYYISMRGENLFVDLPAANRFQALNEGVIPENIWVSNDCTHCLPDKFHSCRFTKGAAGWQYGIIAVA
jgi:YfiH family protein